MFCFTASCNGCVTSHLPRLDWAFPGSNPFAARNKATCFRAFVNSRWCFRQSLSLKSTAGCVWGCFRLFFWSSIWENAGTRKSDQSENIWSSLAKSLSCWGSAYCTLHLQSPWQRGRWPLTYFPQPVVYSGIPWRYERLNAEAEWLFRSEKWLMQTVERIRSCNWKVWKSFWTIHVVLVMSNEYMKKFPFTPPSQILIAMQLRPIFPTQQYRRVQVGETACLLLTRSSWKTPIWDSLNSMIWKTVQQTDQACLPKALLFFSLWNLSCFLLLERMMITQKWLVRLFGFWSSLYSRNEVHSHSIDERSSLENLIIESWRSNLDSGASEPLGLEISI